MPRIAYVNGRYIPHQSAQIHIEDRGFQFADGIYEVVALIDGELRDEVGHLDRLERSLGEIAVAMPMPRRVLQIAMREMVRRNRIKNGALYIQVSRGIAARDFKFPSPAVRPTLVMTLRHMTFDIPARKAAAKPVVTVPDIRWKRRDIKSTALLGQVLAKQIAVNEGAAEAWMVDDDGFITEGASSNAWIIDAKGRLITRPAAHNAILKGVTRSALQALCKQEGIEFVERAFTPKEAYKAREAFTSSATALIMPVSSIDGHKIGNGKIGPVTDKLYDLYMEYAMNPSRKEQKWNPR
ncbi:MAG TPA: D-amino-acid transaminase [Alphaproteobacteria bacterium]|nr:D-amino acid aminotransferase [Rhodospirillaceae bacterium]HRJ66052.1 D-amino-acid transaminase [Alphaproteobacteria bacterium]